MFAKVNIEYWEEYKGKIRTLKKQIADIIPSQFPEMTSKDIRLRIISFEKEDVFNESKYNENTIDIDIEITGKTLQYTHQQIDERSDIIKAKISNLISEKIGKCEILLRIAVQTARVHTGSFI